MPSHQDDESSQLESGEIGHYGSTNKLNNNEKESLLTAATCTSSTESGDHDVPYNGHHHKRMSHSLHHNHKDMVKKKSMTQREIFNQHMDALTKIPMRRIALDVSLYVNLIITVTKLVAYLQTFSLSVLAALLDSVLDVVSQFVLSYTEKHSGLQRSSAFYPAGAARLEPIGVLTCAALMGMGSFEVLKESVLALIKWDDPFTKDGDPAELSMGSFWSMCAIVIVKLLLLILCQRAAESNVSSSSDKSTATASASAIHNNSERNLNINVLNASLDNESQRTDLAIESTATGGSSKIGIQMSDPTLEALAQDHWNDALSNTVAAAALLAALQAPQLWFLDPVGAILISVYIIWSWFETGKEQIEQLTGKSAPEDFIEELLEIANHFDERMLVDVCRAYHFGPKFLVELEVVLPKNTLLFESHDLGMELQYEIESREEVERCFVHIDYEQRPYDEHVVSKVPELREKYRPGKDGVRGWGSSQSM